MARHAAPEPQPTNDRVRAAANALRDSLAGDLLKRQILEQSSAALNGMFPNTAEFSFQVLVQRGRFELRPDQRWAY